jgi:methionyl-tRNA synthetase
MHPPSPRRLLVTSALPYANGHIHLGHLVEYIQTDVFVRYQRLRGCQAVYVCADDTHGTAIMLRARSEGRPEQELIADMQEAHRTDFSGFHVAFDHYGSTDSPTNRELCEQIWKSLRDAELVISREVRQLFDTEAGVFLADRFVRGTCPRCSAADQYGDSCESCGATYSPADLIDPRSTLTGGVPEVRSAEHLFVQLEKKHAFLDEWTQRSGAIAEPVANYLAGHFLSEPLRDWDISRPAPYFGFEIPDFPDHYWYVWFDAPIGYLAATREWAAAHDECFETWWKPLPNNDSGIEVHHFIGKDITYFHTLFWPAMLETAGLRLPKKVHVHGFLTVNGQKMSKSRGTFILASTWLEHVDAEMLRYFYASKISGGIDDIDLDLDDFIAKVNADIVGKIVNLASRTIRWLAESGLSSQYPDDGGLFSRAASEGADIAAAYEAGDLARAMRIIMQAADRANAFVDERQPWKLAKAGPESAGELQDVASIAVNLFRQLMIYLAPVMPALAKKAAELVGGPIQSWDQSQTPLAGCPVAPFQSLKSRVTSEQIAAVIAASQQAEALKETVTPTVPPGTQGPQMTDSPQSTEVQPTSAANSPEPLSAEPLAEQCTIDDFAKVDLRVARVITAEEVPEARKLLKLTVSLGGTETRTIFAGIKGYHEPASLVGRLVVVVANLAPRKMKFGLSEGMVVAASGEAAPGVYLISPESGALPGMRLR